MLTVEVSNFGPLLRGKVELRPLTILAGRNNYGKSYLSVLLYSVLRAANPVDLALVPYPPPFDYAASSFMMGRLSSRAEAAVEELDIWMANQQRTRLNQLLPVPMSNFPVSFRSLLLESIERFPFAYRATLEWAIERAFGAKVSDLSRYQARVQPFQITISDSGDSWHMAISSFRGALHLKSVTENFEQVSFSNHAWRTELFGGFPARHRVRRLVRDLLRSMYRSLRRSAYYLPAARSGAVYSHRVLTQAALAQVAQFGLQSQNAAPSLPGTFADFLKLLVALKPTENNSDLSTIVQSLESDILHGTVDLVESDFPLPEITYTSQNSGPSLAIHRTSSMIAELSALVLYLKYVISPGDVLIFEEPESQLHPAAQRQIAHILAQLVRARVQVMITTHSDYLLGELSNLVKRGGLEKDERISRGYHENEFLNASEVSMYWLSDNDRGRGRIIMPITVDTEAGIPDEEFAEVVESLYQESASLG